MYITATVRFTSVSPYSQSAPIATVKDRKETHDDFENRTWRERLHVTKDGKVFMPAQGFKLALVEAAKYSSEKIPGKGNSTYTKHITSGVMCVDPLVLDIDAKSVEGERLFVPPDGVSGSGKRVWKTFPLIPSWSGDVEFIIVDELVTKEVFMRFMEDAGKFIGLGRWRPSNKGSNGRFRCELVSWK